MKVCENLYCSTKVYGRKRFCEGCKQFRRSPAFWRRKYENLKKDYNKHKEKCKGEKE